MSEESAQSPGIINFGKNIEINTAMPLPQFNNGEAKAYDACDTGNRNKKFIAVVAGVESLPRWREISSYKVLSEPCMLRFIGSGIIHWPQENRQKHVILYQAVTGEQLVMKGMYSKTAWRHPEIVDNFIMPVFKVMKEMNDRGFFHGSIRATNIFYGNKDKAGHVILGDGLSAHYGSTQPAIYLPIEKMQTHPMGRGEGCIEDDLYAFGVSLAMFLRKYDAMEGMSDEQILHSKIENGSYNTIVGGERFQASFMELLRGLLCDDSRLRWKLEDLSAWLDGARITPPPITKLVKATRPIEFGGKNYLYPAVLAADLHKKPDEVGRMISDGRIQQWIDKSTDDKMLQERFDAALSKFKGPLADNKAYVAAQVASALNPMLPIYYGGYVYDYNGLGGVLAHAAIMDNDLSSFRDVLSLGISSNLMQQRDVNQVDMMTYYKLYDQARSSLKQQKVGYGMERCIYMLCKNTPCLSPKLKGYFVNGTSAMLVSLESLCKLGGQIALFFDRHSIAFFSVLSPNIIERSLFDLNSSDKDKKIAGNLRVLSLMQQRSDGLAVPAIAGVLADSLSGVFKAYKNKALRKAIEGKAKAAAQAGDLVTMVALLDDDKARSRDEAAFLKASNEFVLLQKEHDYYDKELARKGGYGVGKGRDVAAIVAWILAMAITVITALTFLSGYDLTFIN